MSPDLRERMVQAILTHTPPWAAELVGRGGDWRLEPERAIVYPPNASPVTVSKQQALQMVWRGNAEALIDMLEEVRTAFSHTGPVEAGQVK